MIEIRNAIETDEAAIWAILEPIIRSGEAYALPRDMERAAALGGYWTGGGRRVYVAEADGEVVGSYYLRANQMGPGAHVANCGYATAEHGQGRGVARAMCSHSLEQAKALGFRAVQFNFVVSTNMRAVRLWESFGFETLCRLPEAFEHPRLGFVDALVMFKRLDA